jgi:hypothetical protein
MRALDSRNIAIGTKSGSLILVDVDGSEGKIHPTNYSFYT